MKTILIIIILLNILNYFYKLEWKITKDSWKSIEQNFLNMPKMGTWNN